MNLLSKSINIILLFILFIIIIFSSISFYNYLELIEKKRYLIEQLKYYENQKNEYERILEQIENKDGIENLKILLLLKKRNEKYIYFNNKITYPSYLNLKNKNLYVLLYILIASLIYLLILQDFIKNFEKNNELYKYNFRYFKGINEKNI